MPSPRRLLTTLVCAPALCAGLVACSEDAPEPAPSPSPTSAEAVTSATSATSAVTSEATTTRKTAAASAANDETTETGEPTASASSAAATTTRSPALSSDVRPVAERFASLAPASLFEKFDSCNPSGIDGGYECSGAEIGQFQFFESDAKAASTTQLLTELRSSRVVYDEGSLVVGWSTLGTTAVITVVDNREGLVMQQLISSDRQDPEEWIEELGLNPDA